ncbi:transketolase family protein [uncultured Bilophila sp.]|uniref:transketolase family protein n=1 Tax=uncultured Bilophila sp. TaxID=529385 RepID=UPI00280BD1D4|nr:transketolase family protein [uncultured Bilophila sp.]
MLESQEMRKVYCDTMIALAKEDPRIVDVEADLTGAHGMKPFKAAYPDRSFNVGIAEANMVGVAAGLSACGKIPFVHSFATFASRRCFDQIAISVCYAGLNVKIVGSDPGVGAELNGGTHMALEDMGIMRTLPGMTVFEPTDSVQLRKALPAIVEHEGPVYIRLFRRQAENVFGDDYEFDLGKADLLRDGSDVTLIASGVCVANALQAAETLAGEGLSARVLNMHTIKPVDAEAVIRAASETGALVTAENHNVIGGLGSAVAEVLAERRPTPLERVGVKDHFGQVGKAPYLMGVFGITAEDIAKAARKAVARK